ncbi:MAG: TolC family protein [Deltaproteobacteria bacterium]|nr:TolC family protein [Deltaproteobacteria bacterium]
MTRRPLSPRLVLALSALALAAPVLAQQPTGEQLVPPGLLAGTPFHVDEMERESLAEIEGSPIVLREALATSLARNPVIREQLLGPVVSEAELEARKGVYALSFFADAAAAQSVTPQASALAGAEDIDLRTQRFGAGLEQPIEASGGSVRLGIENQIEQTNSAYASLSPSYVPTLTLELKQPLLRGLLLDRSRAQIQLAEIDRTQSGLALTQTVRDVVRVVEQDYWELHHAMQIVRINRLALELGKALLGNDRRRFEVGVLPKPDLLDDEASVARLEDDLVRTRSALRAASDALRRDLGLPLAGPGLLAADQPTADVPDVGPVDTLVARALAEREELKRGTNVIAQRSIEAEAAENDRLPALDVVAGAGLTGLAGSGRPTSFGGEIFESPFTGSFPDSYDSLATGDYYDWSVGLQLRVPLTSDTADYEAQVASVNRRIAERSLTRTQQDVELEVRRAHDDAATAAARIETSTTAFLRARDNLESEAKRYTLGASRTDDVIRKIEAYARALATVSRARADHRIAIAAVERLRVQPGAGGHPRADR